MRFEHPSNQLAESHLVQWFCHIENFGVVNPPSKSTVDRYFRWIAWEDLDQLTTSLVRQAGLAPEGKAESAEQILGLESELLLTDLWIDNTCLKADIHFPTDWVLLVDAARTLMKNLVSELTIRSSAEGSSCSRSLQNCKGTQRSALHSA